MRGRIYKQCSILSISLSLSRFHSDYWSPVFETMDSLKLVADNNHNDGIFLEQVAGSLQRIRDEVTDPYDLKREILRTLKQAVQKCVLIARRGCVKGATKSTENPLKGALKGALKGVTKSTEYPLKGATESTDHPGTTRDPWGTTHYTGTTRNPWKPTDYPGTTKDSPGATRGPWRPTDYPGATKDYPGATRDPWKPTFYPGTTKDYPGITRNP